MIYATMVANRDDKARAELDAALVRPTGPDDRDAAPVAQQGQDAMMALIGPPRPPTADG